MCGIMSKKKIGILIPTKSFTMRKVDKEFIKDKEDDLKEQFKEYGYSVLLEFNDTHFDFLLSEVQGLSLNMPKSFFEQQLKNDSKDLEITFTPSETTRIFHMFLYWLFGKDYEKELNKFGWTFEK